jgi:TonB family protein
MIWIMDSKKIFLWPVLISLVGHIALIAVSSLVDLRENVRAAEVFSVRLSQPEPAVAPKKEEKRAPVQKPAKASEEKAVRPEGDREDTVDIGSSDVKYAVYLAGLKKKIMRIWKYPADAYKNGDEGIVVIRLTIEADGSLAQAELTTPSGLESLDNGTIDVIRAAAPFAPLPRQYDLERLHIIASFRYRMTQ